MSLILGQLLGLKMIRMISTVYSFLKNMAEPNCDKITMETNLNLNETLFRLIFSFLLGHFLKLIPQNVQSDKCYRFISEQTAEPKYDVIKMTVILYCNEIFVA